MEYILNYFSFEFCAQVATIITPLTAVFFGLKRVFFQRKNKKRQKNKQVLDGVLDAFSYNMQEEKKDSLLIERKVYDYIPYNFDVDGVKAIRDSKNPFQNLSFYKRLAMHLNYEKGRGFFFDDKISSFLFFYTRKKYIAISIILILLIFLIGGAIYLFFPALIMSLSQGGYSKGLAHAISLIFIVASIIWIFSMFSTWSELLLCAKKLEVKHYGGKNYKD